MFDRTKPHRGKCPACNPPPKTNPYQDRIDAAVAQAADERAMTLRWRLGEVPEEGRYLALHMGPRAVFTWLRKGQDPCVPWILEIELLAAIEPAGEDGG